MKSHVRSACLAALMLLAVGAAVAEEPEESAPAEDGVSTRSAVFANGRAVLVKRGRGGQTFTFPDVCKTPTPVAGPVPIPYPGIGSNVTELDPGTHKIKGGGEIVITKGSKTKTSSGDEPGVTMGIVSSKTMGKAEFVNYSSDVKFEGKNRAKTLGLMMHNEKNSPVSSKAIAVDAPGAHIIELEDGTFCGVCMLKRRIAAIYKLRSPR